MLYSVILLMFIGCAATNVNQPSIETELRNKVFELEKQVICKQNEIEELRGELKQEQVRTANANGAAGDAMRWFNKCSKSQDILISRIEDCSKKLNNARITTILECQGKLDLCERSRTGLKYEANNRFRSNERAFRDGVTSLWLTLSVEAFHWSEGLTDIFQIRLKINGNPVFEPILNENMRQGLIPFNLPELEKNIMDEIVINSEYKNGRSPLR